jgi:uncharacterized protein (TIGR02271 family)
MDNTMSQWQTQFREGDDVIAADGEKLGSIQNIGANYILVEKGFFFITDYYVPFSAVSTYDADGGKVYLSVTKDEALNSGWDVAPEYDTTMAPTDVTVPVNDATWDASKTRDFASDEHITVPVHEEELTATKRMREVGDVQIDKTVEAREQTLEVPVTEERVNVTRRAVDRDATTGEDTFVEERINVPLRAEEVELEKRTRVAEEIEIDKEQVQRTEKVSGTVRKERVDVDDLAADAAMRRDEMGRDAGLT